ncbi:MAG: ribosome-associated translation inhibitor RaiA [Deltaproteobacteria bacterium]|jgi:putative sigma-54 modulation protein|nr:ribosome-associated translation inhibitor RaiA [Deltaproteobacteria bacterium]
MNIAYTFRNFDPSEHLKSYAVRRFHKLARFMPKANNIALNVNMAVDKFRHKIEVQVSGDNLNISAVEQSQDMYSSVDMVLEKLEAQLKKHVEKVKDKRRNKAAESEEFVEYSSGRNVTTRKVVERDHFEPKPMHVDEAAMQLEQRDDIFLVFLNAETEQVNVLYKRSNGNLGLISPGFK